MQYTKLIAKTNFLQTNRFMRIGIVVNSSWNIYNFRMGLIQSFLKSQHEVIAIAPNDGYAEKLKASGCEFYPIEMDSKGTDPVSDFKLGKQLFGVYKEARLDVVFH
jgi:Glycosyl transferase 4-like